MEKLFDVLLIVSVVMVGLTGSIHFSLQIARFFGWL